MDLILHLISRSLVSILSGSRPATYGLLDGMLQALPLLFGIVPKSYSSFCILTINCFYFSQYIMYRLQAKALQKDQRVYYSKTHVSQVERFFNHSTGIRLSITYSVQDSPSLVLIFSLLEKDAFLMQRTRVDIMFFI